MTHYTRRAFIKTAGVAAGVGALSGFGVSAWGAEKADKKAKKARVVVLGGGYGGTIAAKYLKLADPNLEVTLIERDATFISCPMSNEILSGDREIASLSFDYKTLGKKGRGIRVVKDEIQSIDPVKRSLKGASGKKYGYDKLVVSPGIDFQYDKIEGYGAEVADRMPHAWKAGPQTLLLRKQLLAMPDGGVCYIVAPPNPFRCPPGPYERAAQIAHYFKAHKPKSKVIILDAKDKFSKQALFMQGYEQLYPGMVEWVAGASGGIIEAVRPADMTLVGQVDEYKGDVINLIPAQKAGPIAHAAGLVDESGWCPVDQKTFESSLHKDIHVIGDACIAGAMPKSAYAANSQAKVCAVAIVAALNGQEAPEPSYVNTCYSLIAPDWGISVAGIYILKDGKIVEVEGSGGVSPLEASPATRALEARYARSWFTNITTEMFG